MIQSIRRAVLAVIILSALALTAHAQLPSGWTDQDIGTVSYTGTATYSTGTFTVSGSGTGLGGTADSFNYCYQSFTGDFVFIARVTGNTGNSGIMMRESLSPGAREETAYSPNTVGAAWIYCRPETSASGALVAEYSGPGSAPYYPLWLKITRHGDYIYKYYSTNGTLWLPMYGQDAALNDPDLASTVYVGMAVTRGNAGATVTGTFDNVSLTAASTLPTLPGKYSTSWMANSLGQGGNDDKMQYDVDGMYVGPDGTCYCNTWSEDVQQMLGVYKASACEGYLNPTGGDGGAAVTSDGTYLYYAQAIATGTGTPASGYPPSNTTWYTVARFNESTYATASFTGGKGSSGNMLEIGAKTTGLNSPGNVWGLACNPSSSILYASDTLNGKVDVISTSSMSATGTWTMPSGYAPYGLCWDSSDSLLWVIVQNTSSGARQIIAYNSSGTQQTALTITAATKPVSMAYYSSHLYVADNGSDQNIKVFGSLTSTPTQTSTIGVTGGTFSGTGATIGTVGTLRFNGLTSIGIDSSGNIYVAYDGYGPDLNENNLFQDQKYGATLQSYVLSSSALNWTLNGLEFVDAINIDPANEASGYGNETHYNFNWSNTTPGTEWSAVGNTLNFGKYTTEYRITASNVSSPLTKMVRISGSPFLALGDGYHLEFYRFNSSTDGEGAIPCGEFNVSTTDPGHTGLAIWTDANGDGIRQLSEVAYLGNYINPMFGADIDTNGNVWTTNSSGAIIDKFPCAGLNSVGAPEYSPSSEVATTVSGLPGSDKFSDVNEVRYDQPNDTMYLLGFTTNYPKVGSYPGQGEVVQCITHWSTTPTFAWESVIPYTNTGSQYTSQVPEAFTIAGSYVFVQYQQNYVASVLAKSTGALVGTLSPDPDVVSNMSPIWTDESHAISAFQRSNGEYIITVEDDIYNKSVMYRWTPWTDIDIGNYGIAGSSSYNLATGTFTLTGSGVGITDGASNDAFHFTYLPMTGNFTISGYLAGVTCTSNSARAGLVVCNDFTTGSEYAAGLGSTNAGDRVGGFWRVTTGGTPSGNDPAATPPAWFKIVRSGNSFTVYHSSDGSTWTSYGSNTISMNSTIYVGLGCCAGNNTVSATATISNLTITQP